MVTFGELWAPKPLDFLPVCTEDPFPLRSCHLTTVATKHGAGPSSLWFFRSDFLTSVYLGTVLSPLAFLSLVCLVSPSLVKQNKTNKTTKTALFMGLTSPSGSRTRCRNQVWPIRVTVIGSRLSMSCDQAKPGTSLELLEKSCSPSFKVLKAMEGKA